jgi:RNA polymerase sigma-70 factor (ECF subfamily)
MTAVAPERTAAAVESARADCRRPPRDLDSDLTQRHLEGDPQAFGVLVDRYQTRLLNFIHRTIGDRERAEDLVQEVFIRGFRHLHRLDQTKTFSTWIYTVAANLAQNELRSRRNPVVFHLPLECADADVRPDDVFHRGGMADRVAQRVRRLARSLGSVFVFREFAGKSYPDITAIAGRSLRSVKSRLIRAWTPDAQARARGRST